jgi:tetratricopeptide (TPR) repeat protein
MSNPSSKPATPPKTPQPAPPTKGSAAPAAPPAHVPPLYRGIDWWTFSVTTLLVFIGYWWTLAPDLTLEDCGELAVASMYAGVPHPPGYPVWTIYSWFFTLLPISNIAYRVALSSAVAGALSCGLVALMVSRGSSMMIEGIAELKTIERKWENALCMVSGFVAGMLIGFNGFMWSQAVIVEVYTLSVLSMTGVLACLLRWIYAPHHRRYLYMALFWFGICFNNHQSLLVIALGIEVAVTAVSPKFGRNFWMWNVVFYLGGLAARSSLLEENTPLKTIFHIVGFGSLVTYLVLLVKTKIRGLELLRDILLVGSLGCLALILLAITNYVTAFEFRTGLFVLFVLFSLCVVGAFLYLARETWSLGSEWLSTFIGGWFWAAGVSFYLYMALASMSNPPLNWGYPRTVQGFIHAFTRGQYERIHPTTEVGRYIDQLMLYVGGALDEFNVIYILIGLVPFLFFSKMQKRERAWLIGLTATYLTLSLFLLALLNPAPDRQSRDLNRVFFTASHFMIAMGTGYGLTLIGAYLSTQYERWRKYCLMGSLASAAIALLIVAVTYQGEDPMINFHSLLFDLAPSYSPIVRFTVNFSLGLGAAAVLILYLHRTRAPMMALLTLFAILPFRSVVSHWEDNEQRGHYFGYWFGHDMFRPPFKDPVTGKFIYDSKRREELLKDPQTAKFVYPEMERDTVLYGGTDPGRFNPTYMIFCESFIPPEKRNFMDREFDRRDVILITQNALADGTYLQYIRAQYNRSAQIDPPFFTELARGPQELLTNERTNLIARMMRPLDRIFLGLGDRIEKKRRAGTSFFEPDHFTDLPGLAAKLRSPADPLARHLADNLSADTKQRLGGNDPALANSLARDLNRLLEAGALYETNRFAHLKLTDRTLRFIKEDPKSHTRIRLNRILLEEAFPREIAKSIGGVYPDMEMITASNDDSARCFKEYLDDAQRRLDHDRRFPNEPRQIKPGEDVRIVDNRVTVSGQVAVMAINALLTKVMFDKNPDREFYVEESFPLDWMYEYLSPYGIIMKINRNKLPELTQEMVDRDHEFWAEYSKRLIGNWIAYDTPVSNICAFAEQVYYRRKLPTDFKGDPAFIRDNDGQKAFSKLRSSIAGVYNWRIGDAQNKMAGLQLQPPTAEQQAELRRLQAQQQRMLKEAEFAFKQAYAFCPYSPEALFRWVNLLITTGRTDDALLIATTSQKLDPFNAQIENLILELKRIRLQQGGIAPPPVAAAAPDPNALLAQLAPLEQQFKADPKNLQLALQLAGGYMQAQQHAKAIEVADQILANPKVDSTALISCANLYAQLGHIGKVEQSLAALVKVAPENPEGRYDLAAVQAMQNKSSEAIETLRSALRQSAQRLERDPKSPNLYSNALGDARFAALRALPEFVKVMESFKPK